MKLLALCLALVSIAHGKSDIDGVVLTAKYFDVYDGYVASTTSVGYNTKDGSTYDVSQKFCARLTADQHIVSMNTYKGKVETNSWRSKIAVDVNKIATITTTFRANKDDVFTSTATGKPGNNIIVYGSTENLYGVNFTYHDLC
jgi:7-cyano-7-deazaguanine synthase in queuosine biosynthesis